MLLGFLRSFFRKSNYTYLTGADHHKTICEPPACLLDEIGYRLRQAGSSLHGKSNENDRGFRSRAGKDKPAKVLVFSQEDFFLLYGQFLSRPRPQSLDDTLLRL